MTDRFDPKDLTQEDVKTIRRCFNEALWYRCLPITGFLFMGTRLPLVNSYISSYRAIKIVTYLTLPAIGYLLGQMSYAKRCKHLIMGLEDSRLKDYILSHEIDLRARRFGGPSYVHTPTESELPMQGSDFGLPRNKISPENLPPPHAGNSYLTSPEDIPSRNSDYNPDRPFGSFFADEVYTPKD